MTELIDRLKHISVGDHARGCQGREYTCDCGFDKERDNALEEAIAALEISERRAQEMREALRLIVDFNDSCERDEGIGFDPSGPLMSRARSALNQGRT